MKKLMLAFTALALCSASFAQLPAFPKAQGQDNSERHAEFSQLKQAALAKAGHGTDGSGTCPFPFTSGSNQTFLSYCVSGDGNVITLETPQGQPEISLDQFEGYGICDITGNTAYSDFGASALTPNWGSARVLSNKGTSVKIARTTSDGIWTLTQTFNQVSGNTPNVKITMALKNNSNIGREAFLVRWADVDAGAVEPNEADATFNTAFIYNSFLAGDGIPVGLVLQNQGNSPFAFGAVTYNTPVPPDPCNPLGFAAGELIGTDASFAQIYLMNLGRAQTGKVVVAYRGL